MKKIFFKKDFKDINTFLNENDEVTLSDNYKGLTIKCERRNKKHYIIIINSIGEEHEHEVSFTSNYEETHQKVLDIVSDYEEKFINCEAETKEEAEARIQHEKELHEQSEKEKNFAILSNYLSTGNENDFADCVVYYENKTNLANAVDTLINKAVETNASIQIKTALLLKTVYDKQLFRELGYKNIYEYADDRFNIARGTTSNWLMIAEHFGVLNTETGFYMLDERLKKYSITQLILLRNFRIEQIESFGIDENTSCSQIKKIVKEKINQMKLATSASNVKSDKLPDNPEDESELYNEADEHVNVEADNEKVGVDESINPPLEEKEDLKSLNKPKLTLVFKGGTTLNMSHVQFINSFLKGKSSDKEYEVCFYEKKAKTIN